MLAMYINKGERESVHPKSGNIHFMHLGVLVSGRLHPPHGLLVQIEHVPAPHHVIENRVAIRRRHDLLLLLHFLLLAVIDHGYAPTLIRHNWLDRSYLLTHRFSPSCKRCLALALIYA